MYLQVGGKPSDATSSAADSKDTDTPSNDNDATEDGKATDSAPITLTEGPEQDAEAEQDAEESAEDDSEEFERLPLHDLNLEDEGWVKPKSERHGDSSSEVSTSSAVKRNANLPGWYDGEDDDVGWITPENHAEIIPSGCEGRGEDDDGRVACATTDFAMQNVLLQIGLRVLNMDGLVVREVKQYVLKCHACFKICHDASKLFCPACGNATLMRVSMYVNADGTVGYSKGIKNFNLRGTKYSLPLPKQGRGKDDLVLREDQLLLSRHRRRPAPKADADGFVTFSPAARAAAGGDGQEIIGMGFRCAPPRRARGEARTPCHSSSGTPFHSPEREGNATTYRSVWNGAGGESWEFRTEAAAGQGALRFGLRAPLTEGCRAGVGAGAANAAGHSGRRLCLPVFPPVFLSAFLPACLSVVLFLVCLSGCPSGRVPF